MTEREVEIIVTIQDGTKLPVRKKAAFDLLPDPKKAAREGTGMTDRQVHSRWLYANNGKAPR